MLQIAGCSVFSNEIDFIESFKTTDLNGFMSVLTCPAAGSVCDYMWHVLTCPAASGGMCVEVHTVFCVRFGSELGT